MHRIEAKTRRVSITLPVTVYAPLHRFAQRKVWSDSQAVALLLTKVFEKKSRAYFKALGVG